MSRIEVLESVAHSGLRVVEGYGAQFGDSVQLAPVVASELENLVVEYPIVFLKNPETGLFGMFALLGFQTGENRFLRADGRWGAHYVPLYFRCQPFVTAGSRDGSLVDDRLAIDVAHPRISANEGRLLFEPNGEPGKIVDDAKQVLAKLVSGQTLTYQLLRAITDLDLLDLGRIEVPETEPSRTIGGFYVIVPTRVQALSAEMLQGLNTRGFLLAIHLILASMANIPKMAAANE